MRVISGYLGGRVFAAPDSSRIHPMSEKVRGAIFATLGDVSGLRVLDLYSGSGALGIEAVSRGASEVLSIEVDPQAVRLINKNLIDLKINDKLRVINVRLEPWLKQKTKLFDLILADPPYDRVPTVLTLESISLLLKLEGLMVLSWPGNYELPQFKATNLLKIKNFNDAQVGFYRKQN